MDSVAFDQFLQDWTSFISDEMFEEIAAPKRNMEDAIDWRELPINVIYEVKLLTPVQTKFGNKVLLTLVGKDGLENKVWCPTNVSKELKLCAKSSTYIKSLGEKTGKTSSGRNKRYFDFETANIRNDPFE